MPLQEPFTGVWSMEGNEMTGIILADRKKNISELFSFFVSPEKRNQNLGNQLLSMLESKLQKEGVTEIRSRYRSDWGSVAVIEKMIGSHGWRNPELLRIIAETNISEYEKANWIQVKIPNEYSVFPWQEITHSDRENINDLLKTGKVPREFNPFQHEDKIFLPVSTGIRYKGSIAGWNIAFRLKEDMLEYNNLFLMEEHRMTGLSIPLLFRSFGEQYRSTNIPKATWMINADNRPIMKIANRIAGGFLSKFVEVRTSVKILS